MSTELVTLALLAMIGGAQQMKIDPARMGAAQATLTPKQRWTGSVSAVGARCHARGQGILEGQRAQHLRGMKVATTRLAS